MNEETESAPSPERQRSRQLIKHLLENSKYTKKVQLSDFLGYKSPTGLSEVYSMKVNFNKPAKIVLRKEFNVNIDWLENGEGSMFTDGNSMELPAEIIPPDNNINAKNREYITFVPLAVQAGFFSEYPDNRALNRLPQFNIPGYHNGEALAFPVEGDSMVPTLKPNDIVIAEPVNKLEWINPKEIHVVISDRGRLIKRWIYHKNEEEPFLEWIADNKFYNDLPLHQRSIPAHEVKRVFKRVMHISNVADAPDETLSLIKEILNKLNTLSRKDIELN